MTVQVNLKRYGFSLQKMVLNDENQLKVTKTGLIFQIENANVYFSWDEVESIRFVHLKEL